MDGYRGTINFGSRTTKWLCEGTEAAWRVLVRHHRQGYHGSKRVRGKEDRWHATMPSLLIYSIHHVVLALRGVCLPRSGICRPTIRTKLRDDSSEELRQRYVCSSSERDMCSSVQALRVCAHWSYIALGRTWMRASPILDMGVPSCSNHAI